MTPSDAAKKYFSFFSSLLFNSEQFAKIKNELLKLLKLVANVYIITDDCVKLQLEASEPKWVNPDAIKYGVNSLRLGASKYKLYRNKIIF